MLKKTSFIFSLLCLIVLSIQAQGLKFHDGQFKIVQFTDLHYQPANPASQQAIDCIKEVIGKEKPDLIIVTGDIIYARPGNTALQSLLNLFSSQKTPFCMILGNHDPQQGTSATTLYDMMQKTPYDIQPVRRGNSLDYVLPVKSENGLQTEALIYCFDTHSFNKYPMSVVIGNSHFPNYPGTGAPAPGIPRPTEGNLCQQSLSCIIHYRNIMKPYRIHKWSCME